MILRHLLSLLLLPFTVTVVVPALLRGRDATVLPLRLAGFAGVLLMAAGLTLLALTVYHFATIGRGTLAPWDPPKRLVVRGIYRHVRNPMITGVILILAGESLLFGSVPIGLWAATVFAINAIYIPAIEEPGLASRFGEDYEIYRQNVPRWVPRATAWSAPATSQGRQP